MPFVIEKAKSGRSTCKKSKEKIAQGELRIGRIVDNPHNEGVTMTMWYKVAPFFEMQLKQRKTTKKVESSDQLEGFDSLEEGDKKTVKEALKKFLEDKDKPKATKKRKKTNEEKSGGERKKKTKKSPKKEGKTKGPKVENLFKGANPEALPKEAAHTIAEVAKSLGFPLPEDETNAKIKIGQCLMGNKTDGKFDYAKALKALAGELGCPEKIPGSKVKPKKKRTAPEAVIAENQKIVNQFWELGGFEFKEKQNKTKGLAYLKVARNVAKATFKVESGDQVSKGKMKIEGVGKASGLYIHIYICVINRLERYRKGDFE
ncbi:hypothetical protein AAMO2058_000095000 [Amorphochlora amoebiformis]